MPPERTCQACGKPLRKGAIECFFCKAKVPDSASFDEVSFPAVSGYRIQRFVAEGGMGSVYEAEEEALGRRVALKMVSERFLAEEGSLARFQREARVMANVEHPNIVRVYAYGEHEGKPYFAMEFVEGEILSKRIERQGKLPVEEALRILRQAVEALEAAWEKDIVHRDIKPSNILLDKKGRVRVADFGLAKPMRVESDATLTGQGYILGTPHYVSPEQARGQAVDFRSDIYSLGIVLYEMLVGERPFEGTTPFAVVEKHLVAPLPPLREKRSDVPESVLHLLEWMTKKKSADRPPSYEAILEIIQSVLGVTPSTPIPTRTMLRAKRPRKALWLRAAGAAAVVVVLAAIGFFLWRPAGEKRPQEAAPVDETRLVVAVTPFYGPDEDSAKEGRVMAALVEREIKERLGKDEVRVLGIEETKEPVREHEAAREMGERLGASVVLWGEAFALRGETEIQPYFTMVPRKKPEAEEKKKTGAQKAAVEKDPLEELEEQAAEAMIVGAEAPNQIELRKTSAAGVGDMVLFLAGMHALYTENDAEKALRYFEEAPRTAESLRYRGQALLRLGKKDEALMALQEAVALNPNDAQSYAQLGDLHMEADRYEEAVAAYRQASELGDSYTTNHAVFYDGKLYAKESYTSEAWTSNQLVTTACLLALDTATGNVLERHRLPGVAESLAAKGDAIQINFKSSWGWDPDYTMTFSDGKFDHPVFYGGDLLLRMNTMRSGWVLASNFGANFGKKREYVPDASFASQPETLYGSVPKTLEEFETSLREAIEKDPTQPWHLFFLGQALWSQEREEEAAKIWEEMFEGEYPAIPYYEYSWMANDLERLGQQEWADRAYEEALKRRKQLPQPIEWTTLVERLINFHVFRAAAWASRKGVDLERQHLWLERARELTGISIEGEDYVAAAWERYFRERGEIKKAEREAEWLRKAREHPLNFNAAAARADYALYAFMSMSLGFIVFLVVIVSRAVRDSALVEISDESKDARFTRLRQFILAVPNAVRWGGAAVLAGFFIWLVLWAYFEDADLLKILFVLIAVPVVVLWRLWKAILKVGFVRVIEAVSTNARWGIAAALLAMVASSVWLSAGLSSFGSIAAVPIGVMDSLGHATTVHTIENVLEVKDSDEVLYAAAVMNHMAGNVERAKELYQSLPKDERAKKNLTALQKDELVPPEPLTAEDLYRAYTARSWKDRFIMLNPFYAFEMIEEI
jgi:tetratricopeptide (TPR) repeat protein/tRNA A-37 threonylcarbamoyl transferase component Bud32